MPQRARTFQINCCLKVHNAHLKLLSPISGAILCSISLKTPHKTIYGHQKKVCLEQIISIGSFHAPFQNFHSVSIYMWNNNKS